MTNKSLSRREKLELAISQKQAQLKKLEAIEKTKERKRDTRRKIVAGAVVLKHAEINPDFHYELYRLIDKNVQGLNDRELFDLQTEKGL